MAALAILVLDDILHSHVLVLITYQRVQQSIYSFQAQDAEPHAPDNLRPWLRGLGLASAFLALQLPYACAAVGSGSYVLLCL